MAKQERQTAPLGCGAFDVVACGPSAGVLDALTELLTRLPSDFPAAVDGIFSADEGEVIREVNPALCRMLGYEADEIVGREGADLLGPASSQRDRLSLAILPGSICELVGSHRDGSRLPIQVSVGAPQAEGGQTFVATVRG